jgi:hypothetical protein
VKNKNYFFTSNPIQFAAHLKKFMRHTYNLCLRLDVEKDLNIFFTTYSVIDAHDGSIVGERGV